MPGIQTPGAAEQVHQQDFSGEGCCFCLQLTFGEIDSSIPPPAQHLPFPSMSLGMLPFTYWHSCYLAAAQPKPSEIAQVSIHTLINRGLF